MRAIAALVAALALCAAYGPAFAGPDGGGDQFATIGDIPSTDPSNTDFGRCSGPTRSQFGGVIRDIAVHVYARLGGMTANGITGAEFYIHGWEQIAAMGWTVAEFFTSGASPSGSMVRAIETSPGVFQRRLNVGWLGCRPDPPVGGDLVFIGGVSAQIVGGADLPVNTYVSVVPGDPPTNPQFACALLTLCDFPAFTKVCVTGGQFIINPSGRTCTVAVEETTWGELKALYR
jgi:hypothetical protein